MNLRRQAPEKTERLRLLPQLRDCSRKELAVIAGLVDEVVLPAGTVLAREGEVGREAFVIVDGFASATVGDAVVALLGPGDLVGEVAMLDHGPRTATVEARTVMRLLVVGPAAFSSFRAVPSLTGVLTDERARRVRGSARPLAELGETA